MSEFLRSFSNDKPEFISIVCDKPEIYALRWNVIKNNGSFSYKKSGFQFYEKWFNYKPDVPSVQKVLSDWFIEYASYKPPLINNIPIAVDVSELLFLKGKVIETSINIPLVGSFVKVDSKTLNHILKLLEEDIVSYKLFIWNKKKEIFSCSSMEDLQKIDFTKDLPNQLVIDLDDVEISSNIEEFTLQDKAFLLLKEQVNSFNLSEDRALFYKEFYPEWGSKELPMATQVKENSYFTYKDSLVKVLKDHELNLELNPLKNNEYYKVL